MRVQLNQPSKIPLKKRLDKTQQMLNFAESTQEEIKKLRTQLICFQKVIKTLEYNEEKLRQQVRDRDEEIDKLKRAIRLKVSEEKNTDIQYIFKQRDELSEQLLIKETEVNRLRKQIGDLRCELSVSTTKPPVCSPKGKHHRSNTLIPKDDLLSTSFLVPTKEDYTCSKINNNFPENFGKFQRMVNCASSMECEFCKKSITTSNFHSHILSCKLDDDTSCDISSISNNAHNSKIEEFEKQISHLKISLGKMKNQKHAALIENEKLLMGLKEAKLKWVMAEERGAEIQLELKNEMKNLLEVISKFRSAVILPTNLSTEIELVIHNSARFFGGRINVKRAKNSPQRNRGN